jgi:acylphosphatase
VKRIQQHLLIAGQVQRVYFRDTTLRLARQLGLSGWVRNRRDGRVEMVIQGDLTAVATLADWCHAGPPAARVESVEIHDEPVDSSLTSFTVRSTH